MLRIQMLHLAPPPPRKKKKTGVIIIGYFPLSAGGHLGQVQLCSFYLPVEIHHSLQ